MGVECNIMQGAHKCQTQKRGIVVDIVYEGSIYILCKENAFFLGVGAGMVLISFVGSIYYNMVIAWSLYYLYNSFRGILPWSQCTNTYNTACESSVSWPSVAVERCNAFTNVCGDSRIVAAWIK